VTWKDQFFLKNYKIKLHLSPTEVVKAIKEERKRKKKMKDIISKMQNYVIIVGLIGSIGAGFYGWGQFNLRLDQIETKTKKVVNLNPLKEEIATLTTQVNNLEKRLDRTESRLDKVGNNDNPLAQ